MRILVQHSGKAKVKVEAAIRELGFDQEDLVFADCDNAQELYPSLNVVQTVQTSAMNRVSWRDAVKAAIDGVDGVLMFINPRSTNYGTIRTYKQLAGSKDFWLYGDKPENDLIEIMDLRNRIQRMNTSVNLGINRFLSKGDSNTPAMHENLRQMDALLNMLYELTQM